jgi:DNA-binding LacI/PurR family transcriptional regulator
MASSSSHRPTILDLAKAAGVSKSTVSAALLNDHRVSAKTRENVRLAAQKMGYTRNPFAATLATRGQIKPAHSLDVAIISHVLPDRGYERYDCRVIQQRLGELGYMGHHYDVFHDHISGEKLAKSLFLRGYCGVIFDQIYEKQSDIFSADWNLFSLVYLGRTYQSPPCDILRPNQQQMIFRIWKEVHAAGYRRPGLVLSRHRPPMLDDTERESALWICQQALPPGEKAVPPCLSAINDRTSFEKWFRRHRPDVLVGFSGLNYFWLREMGVRIPQDVAYASLHGSDFDGAIAGIDQGLDDIRIKAAEHLDFLVRHKRIGFPEQPWEMLGPVRWVPGESLPVCGKAGARGA